jgi:hypothetical protein
MVTNLLPCIALQAAKPVLAAKKSAKRAAQRWVSDMKWAKEAGDMIVRIVVAAPARAITGTLA